METTNKNSDSIKGQIINAVRNSDREVFKRCLTVDYVNKMHNSWQQDIEETIVQYDRGWAAVIYLHRQRDNRKSITGDVDERIFDLAIQNDATDVVQALATTDFGTIPYGYAKAAINNKEDIANTLLVGGQSIRENELKMLAKNKKKTSLIDAIRQWGGGSNVIFSFIDWLYKNEKRSCIKALFNDEQSYDILKDKIIGFLKYRSSIKAEIDQGLKGKSNELRFDFLNRIANIIKEAPGAMDEASLLSMIGNYLDVNQAPEILEQIINANPDLLLIYDEKPGTNKPDHDLIRDILFKYSGQPEKTKIVLEAAFKNDFNPMQTSVKGMGRFSSSNTVEYSAISWAARAGNNKALKMFEQYTDEQPAGEQLFKAGWYSGDLNTIMTLIEQYDSVKNITKPGTIKGSDNIIKKIKPQELKTLWSLANKGVKRALANLAIDNNRSDLIVNIIDTFEQEDRSLLIAISFSKNKIKLAKKIAQKNKDYKQALLDYLANCSAWKSKTGLQAGGHPIRSYYPSRLALFFKSFDITDGQWKGKFLKQVLKSYFKQEEKNNSCRDAQVLSFIQVLYNYDVISITDHTKPVMEICAKYNLDTTAQWLLEHDAPASSYAAQTI